MAMTVLEQDHNSLPVVASRAVAGLGLWFRFVMPLEVALELPAGGRWISAAGEAAAGGEVEDGFDFTGAADHGPEDENCLC